MNDSIHLDTSFLIHALVPGAEESGRLGGWIEDGQPLVMSTLAWCEFLCGPVDSEGAALALRIVRRHAPVGLAEANEGARLFNNTGRRRGSLADCLVAATALTAGAPLATSNPRDFARFEPHGPTLL